MKTCALLLSLLLTLAGCPAWAEDGIVTGPDRRDEIGRRHAIDRRLEELEAERAAISTRGPKATMFTGLGMMVLGVAPLVVGLTADQGGTDDDPGEWPRFSGGVASGATLLAVGLITWGAGALFLRERVRQRDEIDAEREWLLEKRAGLADTLSRVELQSTYRDDTHFVTLGLRF